MATSSITKQFVVTDIKAFEQLQKQVEAMPLRHATNDKGSALAKGREKLKQFSVR